MSVGKELKNVLSKFKKHSKLYFESGRVVNKLTESSRETNKNDPDETNRESAERQYLNILKDCLYNGVSFPEGERTGVGRFGLWQRQIRVDLSKYEIPLLTTKYVPFKTIVKELLWIINGSTNVKHLQKQDVHIWDEWANSKTGDIGFSAYGGLWRNFDASYAPFLPNFSCDVINKRWISPLVSDDGIDQLVRLVEGIKKNPASTRHVICCWHPRYVHQAALPPCHTWFRVKIDGNGLLHSSLTQRSCDMFLGVPFNLASYSIFTRMLASVTGYKCGTFVHNLEDCHIYDNQVEAVKEQLKQTVKSSPLMYLYDPPDDIREFDLSNFNLLGYEPGKKIKAEVAL